MERIKRGTILIKGEERLEFESEYAAAKAVGVNVTSLQQAKRWETSLKGWDVYDTPDKIRERIARLEKQIKLLED